MQLLLFLQYLQHFSCLSVCVCVCVCVCVLVFAYSTSLALSFSNQMASNHNDTHKRKRKTLEFRCPNCGDIPLFACTSCGKEPHFIVCPVCAAGQLSPITRKKTRVNMLYYSAFYTLKCAAHYRTSYALSQSA